MGSRSVKTKDVGSIAIDDGGFGGPNYSEELSERIDGAIKEISDERLGRRSGVERL